MNRLKVGIARFLRLLKDRSGVSTVEYALIVVAVIAIVGSGVALLGGGFKDMFKAVQKDLQTAQSNTQQAATP